MLLYHFTTWRIELLVQVTFPGGIQIVNDRASATTFVSAFRFSTLSMSKRFEDTNESSMFFKEIEYIFSVRGLQGSKNKSDPSLIKSHLYCSFVPWTFEEVIIIRNGGHSERRDKTSLLLLSLNSGAWVSRSTSKWISGLTYLIKE